MSYIVAKGVVEAHNGSLEVRSSGIGLGSTFTIVLDFQANSKSTGVKLPFYQFSSMDCVVPFDQEAPKLFGASFKSGPYKSSSKSFAGQLSASRIATLWASESEAESSNRSGRFVSLSVKQTVESEAKVSEHYKWLPRVLVVDDSMLNRTMLIRLLRSRCESCESASDGVEAVAMVKLSMENGRPFDVILMDSVMPNMDGPTAAKNIRAMGYDGIMVAVTGNTLPEDVAHFKAQGVDDVLFKPLNIVQYDEVISSLHELKAPGGIADRGDLSILHRK